MIRIEGRDLVDPNFGGSNARDMDTGRMSKEAALFLTETIKKAIAPINNVVKTNKVVIAQTASNMAKIIEQNTKEFQTIIQDSGEDTQQELLKLLSMMNDAQKKTGDASVAAMKAVVQQIENLKRSDTTGKLSPLLDLDKRQKEIAKPLGRQTVFGAAFKKFTNVDLRRESVLQALSPTKLFGLDPGTSDIIKDSQTNAATSGVTGAMQSLVGALTPNSDASSQRAAGVLSTITAPDASSSKITAPDASSQRAAGALSTITAPDVNAQGGTVFTTSIDRESLANKQVELLEQILAQLKEMEGGGFSAKSILDKLTPAALGAAVGSVLMKGLKAVRILGPLAVLKDVFDIVAGTDGGASAENVGGVTAGVIGSIAGFMIAGPAGAAVGAGIGNLVGNLVGGYFADQFENRERGPERTRRTAGGRETTTDAPLSFSERERMEEYGTIDREEIQRIQMERAGYVSPSVSQTTPITQLSNSNIKDDPNFQAGILAMTPAAREAFFEQNPELKFTTPQLESTTVPTAIAMENVGAYQNNNASTVVQNNIDNSTTVNQGSSGSPNYVTTTTGARNTSIPESVIGR